MLDTSVVKIQMQVSKLCVSTITRLKIAIILVVVVVAAGEKVIVLYTLINRQFCSFTAI